MQNALQESKEQMDGPNAETVRKLTATEGQEVKSREPADAEAAEELGEGQESRIQSSQGSQGEESGSEGTWPSPSPAGEMPGRWTRAPL